MPIKGGDIDPALTDLIEINSESSLPRLQRRQQLLNQSSAIAAKNKTSVAKVQEKVEGALKTPAGIGKELRYK